MPHIDLSKQKILKLNDNYEYKLLYHDPSIIGETFVVYIPYTTETISEILSNFETISKIEIYENDERTLLMSSSAFSKCKNQNLLNNVYFTNDGEKLSVIALTLAIDNKDLEAEITKLKEQVNPTIDYNSMDIDEYRNIYIEKTKTLLAKHLEDHPITSTAHGGVKGVYSITKEKQDLMSSNYLSYTLEKAINPDVVLTWNETGKECEVWAEQEFIQLIIEIKNYVQPLVSHQQKLETMINNLSDKTEIASLEISYENIV